MIFMKAMNIWAFLVIQQQKQKNKDICFAPNNFNQLFDTKKCSRPSLQFIHSSGNSNGYSVYHFIHNVYTHQPLFANFHFKVSSLPINIPGLYVSPGHEANSPPIGFQSFLQPTRSSQFTHFLSQATRFQYTSILFNQKEFNKSTFPKQKSYIIFFRSSVNIKFQYKTFI